MPHKRLKPEYTFNEDQLRSLKQIVPEAFADGRINWETLKESLGEYLEDDSPDSEHFGLFWPGKRQARRLAGIPSKGTLVPVYGEGLKADGTPDKDGMNDSHNIFIEGENLEVLKILQKSYAGRVKMIYIDPPYNTGKDVIYDDDFAEPLKEYLRRTGQVDEEGRLLTTNTRADGRFHSKWLSMMYPRLRLAKNLLSEYGVIFISIDDNEIYHFRSILNEIYGPENFVGVIKRRAARKTAHLSGTMSDMCDYIVIYSKNPLKEPLSVENPTDNTRPVFNNGNKITERLIPLNTLAKCKDGLYEKGIYKVKSLDFQLTSDLEIMNGRTKNEVIVKGPWRINQNVLNKTVYVTKNFGFRRFLLPEEYETAKAMNDLMDDPEFYNESGSEELEKIFGLKNIFDNPKPHTLVKFLINASNSSNSEGEIVLDFFAGSATTGHGCYIFSKENNQTNLKYILVQMPELCDENSEAFKAGFNNIAEIAKERLRRVVKKLNDELNNVKDKKKHKIDSEEDTHIEKKDYGFKVFKLQESNYKIWKNYQGIDTKELEDLFENSQSPLVDNWRPEKLLAEILLIEGFPLDSKLEQVTGIKKNKVTRVTSDFHEHSLLVCLDSEITSDTIKQLNLTGDDIFICLDNAVTDQDKVRLADKGMIKTI